MILTALYARDHNSLPVHAEAPCGLPSLAASRWPPRVSPPSPRSPSTAFPTFLPRCLAAIVIINVFLSLHCFCMHLTDVIDARKDAIELSLYFKLFSAIQCYRLPVFLENVELRRLSISQRTVCEIFLVTFSFLAITRHWARESQY